MCICGGVGEAAIIVVTGGLVARRLLRRHKPPQKACPKCGAPQARLMYNSDLCFDCYYEILDRIRTEEADAPTNR